MEASVYLYSTLEGEYGYTTAEGTRGSRRGRDPWGGFTDVDGSLPDRAVLQGAQAEAKQTFLAPMVAAARAVPIEWRIAPRGAD